MSIDKQRIAAVAALEELGFKYTSDRGWLPPINSGSGVLGGTPLGFTAEARCNAWSSCHARRCLNGCARGLQRCDRTPAHY